MDRGADRKKLVSGFIERACRFVIRLQGNRHFKINIDGKVNNKSALSIANSTKCYYYKTIKIKNPKNVVPKKVKVYIGYQKGIYTDNLVEKEMTLIVTKGYSKKPMMLLTNLEISEQGDYTPENILEIYLTKWKCNENFIFLKSSYNVEDIRTIEFLASQNLISLLLAVFYFICVFLGMKSRLNILLKEICKKAQNFFQIPDLNGMQYAMKYIRY